MEVELQLFRGLLLISFILTLVFATYSFRNREQRGAKSLTILFVGASFWLLGDIIQVLTPGNPAPTLGVFFRLLGPDITVVGGILFALEYTGRDRLINRWTGGLLAAKPLLTIVVVATPLRDRLLEFSAPSVITDGYEIAMTPYFLFYTAHNWLLVLVMFTLLAHMMVRARYGYQRQLLALSVAFFIPFFFNVLFHFDIVRYDLTTAGFFVSTTVLMYATFWLRLLDTLPIARRTVLEEMGELVFLLDENGTVATVNDAVETTFGNGTVGQPIAAVLGEAVLASEEKKLDITTTIDGERRDFTVDRSTLTDYRGIVLGELLVCRDITERKRRERELAQYTELVQTVSDPMYVVDEEGYFERVNDAFLDYTGYGREELLGTHATEIVDEEAFETGTAAVLDLVGKDEEWTTFEITVYTNDGEEILTEDKVTPVISETGDVVGSVGVMRDIRERKAREQKLKRQNRRLDEFASVVSHDLRNPLGIAQTYLGFARESGNEEDFDAVEESLERMDTMINDLLTMARAETTVEDTEPVVLATLVKDAWQTAQTDGARLENNLPPERSIEADESLLRNVFENLFRNAVDHNETPLVVRVGTLDDGGLYIEDDGSGIPESEREEVFDHGYTTSEEGTGLGLSIVSECIDAHGWTVTATEGSDGGARFEIVTGQRTDESKVVQTPND